MRYEVVSEVVPYITNTVLIALVIAALCTDISARRIPNWQTLPAIGLGVVLNTLYAGHTGLLSSLGGGLIGVALLAVPYLLGGLGAGDVKLFIAIGALKGWPFILWVASYAALIGGLLGILIVVRKRSILQLLRYLISVVRYTIGDYLPAALRGWPTSLVVERPESLSLCLPYGLAIGLGTLVALYLH